MQQDGTSAPWWREDSLESFERHGQEALNELQRFVLSLRHAFELYQLDDETAEHVHRRFSSPLWLSADGWTRSGDSLDPAASPTPTLEHLGRLFSLLKTLEMRIEQFKDEAGEIESWMNGLDIGIGNAEARKAA